MKRGESLLESDLANGTDEKGDEKVDEKGGDEGSDHTPTESEYEHMGEYGAGDDENYKGTEAMLENVDQGDESKLSSCSRSRCHAWQCCGWVCHNNSPWHRRPQASLECQRPVGQ